ncbi:uncharacterized protein [Nerophis lumbriciformis]|uniref:uncharacterized protein n=1 Tax=Nerophis lumbriciformis TaxID=546530 RepID=UPI002ADFEF72|nr:uncharacterized protein LOC133577913 [Nerophis lumbriciformis]
MDNLAANKNYTTAQAWQGQTTWSPASTIHTLSTYQRSAQRTHYNPQQAPDSCFLSTMASVSPASLFAGGESQTFTFDQQGHPAPVLPVDTRGPLQTLPGAPPSSHKASFQSALTNQPFQGVSTLPSFQSVLQESAAFSQSSPAPLMASQSAASSHCGASSNSAHPDKDGTNLTPTSRSSILLQRSFLLKQLSAMNKLLESLPAEDDDDNCGTSPRHNTQLESLPPEDIDNGRTSPRSKTQKESLPPKDGNDNGKASPRSNTQMEWLAPIEDDDNGGTSPHSNTKLKSLSREKKKGRTSPHSKTKERHLSDSSNEGPPDSFPSDDDISDALYDPGKDNDSFSSSDELCRSPDSPVSRRKDKSPLRSRKARKEVAKPDWTLLKNVKVRAMKESRKRVYRRNHCLFCAKAVFKMARHLQRAHSHRAEVAAAIQLPKGTRERQKAWNRLMNEGNFVHNKHVLKTGEGQLAPRKRPRITGKAQDFLHCLHCRGLFRKKSLTCHMRRCPERKKKDNEARIRQERVETRCALQAIGDLGISLGFRAVLSQMNYDDVTRLILTEPVMLQYGEDMFKHYGPAPKRQEYMRQNLRQMARLVLEAWKNTPLKKLEDFFLPDNFQHVVSAVNVLAGHDPASKTYCTPSLAIKLGYSLQKVCLIVQERALKFGDASLVESTNDFLVVYRKEWNKMISSGALLELRKTKSISKQKVPDVQAVKQLNFHVEKVHILAEKKLRAAPSAETYGALARVILARIVLFNRRQSPEVSLMPLTALKSCKKPNPQDNLDISVCELERSMCRVLTRIEIRATSGRMVPVILKSSFLATLELLASVRKVCGVPAKNPYLFGRPHTLSAYRASRCILVFAKDSGAKDPDKLSSIKIRKHHAAMLHLINLNAQEAEQILGPVNCVKSLRENLSLELKDVGLDSEGQHLARLQFGGAWPGQWENCESSRGASGASVINCIPSRRARNKGSQIQSKHKWSEAEVHAVERHMMPLICGHKVPQKEDCIRCLNAEPQALGTRSWKGVKDYVRNRITALKRQQRS